MFFNLFGSGFIPVQFFAFAILTGSVEIEGVIVNIKIHQVGDGVLDFLDSGIAKFNHLATVLAYQVVVLFTLIGLFKLGDIFSELMLYNQVAFQKQLDGVI